MNIWHDQHMTMHGQTDLKDSFLYIHTGLQ